jgi:RNA polymerase sigma-70 factor (ECF subfamily)
MLIAMPSARTSREITGARVATTRPINPSPTRSRRPRFIDRTPAAARKLASRARRRVRGAAPAPEPDIARQREVVDAFLAAAREADFEALVAVLDPDVVFRVDRGPLPGSREIQGARAVAEQVMRFASLARFARPALVNGAAGTVVVQRGRPRAVTGFTVANGRIVEIDLLADPARLRELDLTVLDS